MLVLVRPGGRFRKRPSLLPTDRSVASGGYVPGRSARAGAVPATVAGQVGGRAAVLRTPYAFPAVSATSDASKGPLPSRVAGLCVRRAARTRPPAQSCRALAVCASPVASPARFTAKHPTR